MAHKKAGGSKARQGGNTAGKSRGIKIYDGQTVKAGQILVRQLGTVVKPGSHVGLGRDYTIYSMIEGKALYSTGKKNKKKVSVVPFKTVDR